MGRDAIPGAVLAALLLVLLPLGPALAAGPEVLPGGALNDYLLGPGDLLQVDVFELEELSKTVRVDGDGSITYPMLGRVELGGLTKRAAEEKLARLLESRYVKSPQVTIFLEEMQSGRVSVLGAVNAPGGFPLVGPKSLLDLLSQAGGVSRDAGSRAFLIRGARAEPVEIDLRRLMQEADLSQNLSVAPGDVIYVPQARPTRVYVYGQVEQPGVFDVPEGDQVSVLQAVSMAGGLARRAAAAKTRVVRAGDGGKRDILPVNLERVIAGRDADLTLEDGDIVVVPKSFF
jgi:polysaccharide export outer membrane protein